MPVGYTALKTVASLDDVPSKAAKSRVRRGHAAGNYGKCACCKPLGKLCSKFCHLSGLTKCLIIVIVLLFVVTGVLWIGGAFLTKPASSNLHVNSLCYAARKHHGSGGGEKEGELLDEDPTVPLIRENVYAWYLANTGIIVTLTIFFSCVCCVSYVGLCCGLPSWAKVLGAIGMILVTIMFSIFTIWTVGGVYLIANFDKEAVFTSVCRNMLVYELLLVVYCVTLCLAGTVWCVWRARDMKRRQRTTTRQKLNTTPQILRA